MKKKKARLEQSDIVWFQLYKTYRLGNSLETEATRWLPGAEEKIVRSTICLMAVGFLLEWQKWFWSWYGWWLHNIVNAIEF